MDPRREDILEESSSELEDHMEVGDREEVAELPPVSPDNTPEEQGDLIQASIEDDEEKGLQEGQDYYLLGMAWWKKWKAYVGFDVPNERDWPSPGPITNKSILEPDSEDVVRSGLTENFEFIILPEDAWKMFKSWYGGGPTVRRRCIKAGWQSKLLVEIRPLSLKVIYSRKINRIYTKLFSRAATVREFVHEMKNVVPLKVDSVRIFDFHAGSKLKELLQWDKSLESAQIIDHQYVLIEEKDKNGNWPPDSLYKRFGGSSRSSYNAYRTPTAPGKTGLGNLGNTCFMNSSLQCLASTAPLVDFFLSGRYRDDLNPDNPLGMKGEVAETFKDVLSDLWSSSTSVHEPREFKRALAKFAPQFSGYSQHDSQELMNFLLDGLHEDLNRVKKKPYVELKDAEGRPEAEVATEAWEGYKARNNSIVVDLFQGLLKSTLTCPINGRVAVKFDPYMYLQVPLPFHDNRLVEVTFHFADVSRRPVLYKVPVGGSDDISALKASLSKLCEIPPKCLALMDVYHSRFHREFLDHDPVSDIKDNDDVHGYEIVFSEEAKEEETEEVPEDVQVDEEDVAKDDGIPSPPGAGQEENSDEDLPAGVTSPTKVEKKKKVKSELVHLPILHKTLQPGGTRVLAGTPTVISVLNTVTYRQLYQEIARALKPAAKEELPIDIALATEDDAKEAESLQDRDPYYDHLPGYHKKVYLPTQPLYGGAFNLITANAWGSEVALLPNDDTPLLLKERQTIAVSWSRADFDRYYDSVEAAAFEKHSSGEEKVEEGDGSLSLHECLKLFSTEEQLGENDMWYCSECKEFRQAFKRLEIWSAPRIILFHLKRFAYASSSSSSSSSIGGPHAGLKALARTRRERIDAVVNFPLEGLDMTPFVKGPTTENLIYDCYAVSNHYGSLSGGHYTAYARHRDDGKWYLYDDSSVREVQDPSTIPSEASYMLLYHRRDVAWEPFSNQFDAGAPKEKEAPTSAPVVEKADEEYQLPDSEDEEDVEEKEQVKTKSDPAAVNVMRDSDDEDDAMEEDEGEAGTGAGAGAAFALAMGPSLPDGVDFDVKLSF